MSTSEALRMLVHSEIEQSGNTQADVCRAVRITPKHLCEYLAGRNGMGLDLVDAVLDACDRRLVLATVPAEVTR